MSKGHFISYLKSRTKISKVFLYCLVRVRDIGSETPRNKLVPIFNEYPEVFSDKFQVFLSKGK